MENTVTSINRPLDAGGTAARPLIPFRNIAEAIGRKLDLPVEPRGRDRFGCLAGLAGATYRRRARSRASCSVIR